MTSIIKLQAFSGVEGESPPCYMLQIDEFRFLLDCGWNENFDMGYLENIKKHVHQFDAVLLSYPDPLHLGALPYLVGKCGLNCPVYATIPVYKMGQMFMYDLYQSRHNTEDFDKFTLDDVDAAFDKILQLKYSQTVNLKGKGHGLQITPLPAGHMVGGTIWKIVKDGEEEFVYCIDYNHKKERHLNGCVLDGIGRPHLLITDAFNADYVQARRRFRDEQLMTNILKAMRNDGNVLVTTDTAGRVLELAQLLDQMWRSQGSGLAAYSLALLNNVSYNVVEFAKSQMEWMSDKIMRAFEGQRSNPFQFKHLQLCHSLAELMKVPDPKVVLASTADMQCGFSRDLFVQWCTDPKNCIILTNRTSPGTLARWLIDNPGQRTVTLDIRRRVRLEGAELEQYMRKEKEKEVDAAKKKAELAKKEREEFESSDESEDDVDVDVSHTTYSGHSSKAKHDLMMKSESKTRTGFFKQAKKSYPMFPCKEERIKWDDYGEIIRPEDFIVLDTAPAEEEKMDTVGGDDMGYHDISEVPTKCITTSETLDVNAQIMYIDFEGRSDGESIRKILQQVKPRSLVLVRGHPQAAESLADYCRKNKDITNKIFVPRLNETLDATKESAIFQVKLKDSVVSALNFSQTRETEIAWVDGMLDLTHALADTSVMYDSEKGSEKGRSNDVEMRDDETDLIPTLMPLLQSQIPAHTAVFINEPKLTDFKQILIKEGILAEFSAGVLICNGVVAVKKNETGRLELEGCLCDDYYRVRELLYDQFAIV